jgi:hypothetical protein
MKQLDYKRDNTDIIYNVYKSDYSESRWEQILKILEYLQKAGVLDTNVTPVAFATKLPLSSLLNKNIRQF